MTKKQTKQPLAPDALEKQESLTLQRLISLYDSKRFEPASPRPPANFVDMMNWVALEFGNSLKDQTRLNKFVHNRIIIDGQFLQFCEERKIGIECLYKDSIISWKTEHKHVFTFCLIRQRLLL
jgi:hypothetical protein